MPLKNKVGLPVPTTCLLEQAVRWLAFGENPLPIEEHLDLRNRTIPTDEKVTEAGEALLLALRTGSLVATGIFIEWPRLMEIMHFELQTDSTNDLFENEDILKVYSEALRVSIETKKWKRSFFSFEKSTLYLRSVDWSPNDKNKKPLLGMYYFIEVPTKDVYALFLKENSTASESQFESARRSTRGRPPKYPWDAFYVEIAVRADLDSLPETAAELIGSMAEWCQETWGEEPSESTLKDKIGPIYRHRRKAEGR